MVELTCPRRDGSCKLGESILVRFTHEERLIVLTVLSLGIRPPHTLAMTNTQAAIDFTRSSGITHFLAVGGGSVMDTAKAANLFATYPKADLFEFINAPIGRGTPIEKKLFPLIAGESCRPQGVVGVHNLMCCRVF